MNHTFQSIRVGIFFVLGVVLIYAVYTVIGSRKFAGEEGYRIIAEFENIRTLATGADVRMAGVRIGEVAATELAAGRGRVTLLVDESIRIPSDSIARIAMASLLGQNYISVEYGAAADLLGDGDSILAEAGPDLNEILSQVQQLGERLNSVADSFSGGLEGSGMSDLFSNLNELVTDNRERFDNVLINLEELTGKLNRAEGTLGKLINEDRMYDELMSAIDGLKSASSNMDEALGGARDLIARVEAGEGTLGKLLVDDSIAADLEATMANIREFSEKLKAGEGTLGKLISDDDLYNQLRGILNKADQALDSVGESGPVTAVGAVSGALF
ncbi:MAG: MlaD family protein [Oceanipulchritudo sp.]|jgi:phospholipid/cholesterol/gamma-HCH transport system substrate-binding protein